MRVLSREEARAFYDRLGSKQDIQAYYEDPATADLVSHSAFSEAQAVFEFGCGTGRFGAQLLEKQVAPTATYLAIDLSATMVDLARKRLGQFGPRAEVRLTDGSPPVGVPSATYDRFVSNYVLDLLSEEDIRSVIAEAHRILKPKGLLCLVSLSPGCTVLSKLVMAVWKRVHAFRPSLVGGCRPIELRKYLLPQQWEVRYANRLVTYGMPSEVVVAARR